MKPTSTSRADLLRCMGRGLEPDAAAVVLGYVRVREIEPMLVPEMEAELPMPRAAAQPVEAAPVPEIIFPTERPRLTFLMPVRVESLAPPQPRRDPGKPIEYQDLAVDWSHQGPPLPPLTRWARLAPFLRSRLGAVIPGAGLDERRLMKQVGKGLPLDVLPRRPRQAWAAQAVVLWDVTEEMYPFQRDAQGLLRRLRRERGAQGLEVRLLRRLPHQGDAARIPQGVPLLALSAMGQFQESQAAQEAWLGLARRLGFLGHAFHALNPCPRDRWQPQIATHWPSAVWDRRPRLPRRGGLRALRTETFPTDSENPQIGIAGHDGSTQKSIDGFSESVGVHSSVERLLTLLSPASRIEAPLLRTARLALGHAADAGTEWDAWHHAQCWHSLDCFGFRPGAEYEARLNQRQALTGREAALAGEIGGLMAAHHAGCSSVIAAEAALRAILSIQMETQQEMGTPQRSESEASSLRFSNLCGVKSLLQGVVERLRLLAADPGGEEGRRFGLPGWFPGMVERLSESMRADEDVSQLIAEGLAYAHTYLETAHAELPLGVDGDKFKTAKGEVAKQLGNACYFRLELVQGGWQLVEATLPSDPSSKIVGRIMDSHRTFHLSFADGRQHSYHLTSTVSPLALPPLRSPCRLTLESNLERVHFEARERPAWATRMYYERVQLCADAILQGERYSLNWGHPSRSPRLTQDGLAPRFERIDVSALLLQLMNNFHRTIGANEQRIRLELRDGLLIQRHGWLDSHHLLLAAVTELLTNACSYNRPDGSVYIETRNSENGIVIEVHDNGVGISSEVSKIFARGSHSDLRYAENKGRIGMGLEFVNAFTRRYGGDFTIFSNSPDPGTTAKISLPWPQSLEEAEKEFQKLRLKHPPIESPWQERVRAPSFIEPCWIASSYPPWASRVWADEYGLAAEFHIRSVPFTLRWIPPGSFRMGSPEEEPGRQENEGPQQHITFVEGYWMAETPVTQGQWRAVVEAYYGTRAGGGVFRGHRLKRVPSYFEGPPDLPVESVNWGESALFCLLLNSLMPDGPGFYLPAEAEWEYACRAGTDTALYTGHITIEGENYAPELDAIAWYGGNSGRPLEVRNPYSSAKWPEKHFPDEWAGPHRVRQKQPNSWGLYDMLGNLTEWCSDEWTETRGNMSEIRADEIRFRVARGGSWDSRARFCRSAFRSAWNEKQAWYARGMRLVAGLNKQQTEGVRRRLWRDIQKCGIEPRGQGSVIKKTE